MTNQRLLLLHVLETKLANVKLPALRKLFRVRREVPRVDLVTAKLCGESGGCERLRSTLPGLN